MAAIHRIERGIRYVVHVKSGLLGGHKPLAENKVAAIQDLLHDRMTEMVLRSEAAASGLFTELTGAPLAFIDIAQGGKTALTEANETLGLALSDDEIDYLLNAFTAARRNPTDVELKIGRAQV